MTNLPSLENSDPHRATLGHTSQPANAERFLLTHLCFPLFVFTGLLVVLTSLRGDVWLADQMFAWQGHRWALRSAFTTQTVMHHLGRDLSTLAWFAVVSAWIVSRHRDFLAQWRKPLAYLAISTLLATALVAWIKSWSNMDCPWDLLRYGGDRPYIGLFAFRPAGLERGMCFPSGHASAGYAWMALYFFFRTTRPRWRWFGLIVGAVIGLAFGISQQLRGAHFLSHDVWTAMICWLTALGVYQLFGEFDADNAARMAQKNSAALQEVGE